MCRVEHEGTHRFTGLVDAENTTEFDEELRNLKKDWDEKECGIRSSTQPVFLIGSVSNKPTLSEIKC